MDFISLCIISFTFQNKIILQSNEFQKKVLKKGKNNSRSAYAWPGYKNNNFDV